MRIGRSRVETAQLHLRPEHLLYSVKHFREDDGAPEDVTLVDQVGQAMGILLGLELVAGLLPFFLEQLEDSGAQVRQQAIAHHAFQDDVAYLVQTSFMLFSHGPRAYTSRRRGCGGARGPGEKSPGT